MQYIIASHLLYIWPNCRVRNLQCRGVLINRMTAGQGLTVFEAGAVWGRLDIYLSSVFFFSSPYV